MNKWIIIGLLLFLMSSAAAFYYSTTQKTIQRLTENNAVLNENNKTLSNANKDNLNTIDDLQESYQVVQRDYNQLQFEFQTARSQNKQLRDKLSKHELDSLAAAKPKSVERIINNATSKSLRCFELMSGAPLNEEEANAKNAKQFNSECPWLYDDISPR